MTYARLLGAIAYVAAVSGCAMSSNSSASDSAGASNRCSVNSDCLDGSCVAGTCVARESALEQIALEVVSPAAVTAGEYQQLRYLKLVKLSTNGTYNVALDYVSELTVRAKSPSAKCTYSEVDSEGNLPVALEVLQDPRVSGISSRSYVATSDKSSDDYAARLRVPPGKMDLYIEPTVDEDNENAAVDECSLVPFLALGQTIKPGNVSFEQSLPTAQRLSVDISIPVNDAGKSPLDGFVFDLVDPLLGRRLSTRVTLVTSKIEDGIAHHLVELAYRSVIGDGASALAGRELFRFTPPSSKLAPSFYVSRLAVELFGAERLTINHVTNVPTEVTVDGKVESEASGVPVASQITAVLRNATDTTTGAIAQFRASATSDANGKFQISLLAGDYDVVVSPEYETPYASRVTQWTIAPSPVEQAGKLITLPAISTLTGRVLGTTEQSGEWSATVYAIPSTIGQKTTFVDSLVGTGRSFGRRSATGIVETNGTFALGVDEDRYDVYVRPSEGSGYPWAILANTVVTEGVVGLGTVRLSAPFTFSGNVTVPGTSDTGAEIVLPGALIRAYALFDASGQLVDGWDTANAAVQIGEARANATGQYELLLPTSLK